MQRRLRESKGTIQSEFQRDKMYVIASYDVEAKRTQKFKKICQCFLIRVQNSVFEGELTKAQLRDLEGRLKKAVKLNETVKLWIIADTQIFRIHTFGTQKCEESNFL